MHIPRVGRNEPSFTQFLTLAARLAAPEHRAAAAADLGASLGGIDLVIFIRDPEVDTFVMAPGFKNSVPSGKVWKEFLQECVRNSEYSATLPFKRVDNMQRVVGIAPTSDAVIVVIGVDSLQHSDWLRGILPLLWSMLHGEQEAMVTFANARLAGDAVARTEAMAKVLQQSRSQLQEALIETEKARNDAVEANRVKSEFLATMSHELRTPLNAIGGYSQLLSMGIHGKVTMEQKESLDRIDRSQRHLLGLINDILNLSRLEAGKIEYELTSVDVAEMMRDITPMIDPQIEAKNLALDVRIPPGICVKADGDKLQQIVLNLLSNAVKFTESEGRIEVTAEVNRADSIVWISVMDTGRGIPREKVDAIFEPFTQVNSRHSRTEQGAGLGLSISRDLARGMLGDLTVTSTLGSGSTFVLTLPASE